jgi:DnaJ family protein A protein 2
MSDGQRIVLAGAGDQEVSNCVHYLRVRLGFTRLLQPGLPPGDVIFVLKTQRHESFERSGSDLLSTVSVTLSEALLGFDRILINHLDGRGVRVASPKGKVLTSGKTIVLRNEGMPTYKNPDMRGNLYIVLKVEMPNEDWMGTVDQKVPILYLSLVFFLCLTLILQALATLLPPKKTDIEPLPEIVDEVAFEESTLTEVRARSFPAGSGFFDQALPSQFGEGDENDWEDDEEDDDVGEPPECQPQ